MRYYLVRELQYSSLDQNKISAQMLVRMACIALVNPFTPKLKAYILTTNLKRRMYKWCEWELVVAFIWVSNEKQSSSYYVMQYFWWGCRGNLKLITLGSERVNHCHCLPSFSVLSMFFHKSKHLSHALPWLKSKSRSTRKSGEALPPESSVVGLRSESRAEQSGRWVEWCPRTPCLSGQTSWTTARAGITKSHGAGKVSGGLQTRRYSSIKRGQQRVKRRRRRRRRRRRGGGGGGKQHDNNENNNDNDDDNDDNEDRKLPNERPNELTKGVNIWRETNTQILTQHSRDVKLSSSDLDLPRAFESGCLFGETYEGFYKRWLAF